MKRWTIYCHTHINTGRRYIGLTSRTMDRRWSQHVVQAKNLKSNRSHFANAIRKYGPEAFSHEVLAMSWDLEGANATEEVLIEQWNTMDSKIGFNLMKGGLHTPHPIKNPWDRLEYREKCSKNIKVCLTPQARANHKATINTPEYKQKISIIMKEIHGSPEARAKNSAAHIGKQLSDEHKTKISENTAVMNALKSPEERFLLSRKAYAARLIREASFTADEAARARAIRSEASKKSGAVEALRTDKARTAHRAKCSKLSVSDVDKIHIMRSNGYTQLKVAKILGVSRKAIAYHERRINDLLNVIFKRPVWNKGKNLGQYHKLKISSTLTKNYCIRGHDMNQFRGSHGCRACQKIRNAARFLVVSEIVK